MKAENASLAEGDKRTDDNQETDTIGILEVYDVESEEELNALTTSNSITVRKIDESAGIERIETGNKQFTVTYKNTVNKLKTDVAVSNPANGCMCFVSGLWDTGATTTAISEGLVKALGVEGDNAVIRLIASPGVKYHSEEFIVDIQIPNVHDFKNHHVAKHAGLADHELCIIIGMDIISQGDFCVRNQDGKTVLSFSMEDKQ